MLRVRRHDLVLRSEAEAGEDDVAAVGGRARQRDAVGPRSDQRRELLADPRPEREHALEVLPSAASALVVPARALVHGPNGCARERPERAGVEIREALEHRELGAYLLRRHGAPPARGPREAA